MVYNSLEEAKIAHQEFIVRLDELENEFDVNIVNEYDVTSYYEVSYRDENGKIKNFY